MKSVVLALTFQFKATFRNYFCTSIDLSGLVFFPTPHPSRDWVCCFSHCSDLFLERWIILWEQRNM